MTQMADEDWAQCRIPILMAKAIDQILKTDVIKKNGVTSRSDFVTRIVASWFSEFEKEYGIFVPRNVRKNLKGFETMEPLAFMQ